MTKLGRLASPRPGGLGVTPSVHRLRFDAPDAPWRSVQKVVRQTDVLWAGRPKLGRAAWLWKDLGPPLLRHAPQRLEITPGLVVILCSDRGIEFLRFAKGFKPSDSNSCILRNHPLEWLDFSLWIILVKSHAKIPPKVCRSAGFGPTVQTVFILGQFWICCS